MAVTTQELEAEFAVAQPVYITAQGQPDVPADVEKGVLAFTAADWVLAGFGTLLATGVSVIGLMSSYKALERKAALPASQGGWAWSEPWMLPVGLDLSILAFSIINLVLIRVDRPAAWVKWIPRLGALGTIYLNWVSAGSLASEIGHAVLAALWVVFSEIAAHVYAGQIDAIHHRPRMEGVRFSRWLLDPWSTAVIARQMKLWEITSYERALEFHKERAVYREHLTQRYGTKWRRRAPTEALLPVRLAKLGITVTEALDLPSRTAAEAAVREHEAGVRARALALRIREEEATTALAEVARQSEIDTANMRAETARLAAEAELIRAREEARTAAESIVRKAELAQRLAETEAETEAQRLRAEAEAKGREAVVTAQARAAEIQREDEKRQLTWQSEQAKLRREHDAAELAAKLERERLEREQRQARAVAEAAAARRLAQEQHGAEEANRMAADARRMAAEALRTAAVQESAAAVSRAEAERREAEEKAAKAAADASAAEQERAMAVSLEAASVAHEAARRTPAERQAYIVADMIRKFGETKVTVSYIERALGLPHTTAQARRDRARQILANPGESTEATPEAA